MVLSRVVQQRRCDKVADTRYNSRVIIFTSGHSNRMSSAENETEAESARETATPASALAPTPSESPSVVSLRWVVAALVAGLVTLAVTIVALRPRERVRVVSVFEGDAAEAFDINLGGITDTLREPGAVARVGRRYRVRIEDESGDGQSGVARIGGLVTFVPEARRGQIAVIEVTDLRARTASASLVRVESEGPTGPALAPPTPPPVETPPAPPAVVKPAPTAPADEIAEGARSRADDVQPGRLFRVEITEPSRQQPDREAVTRIGGLVTIVRGARVGEHRVIRIVERRARVAFAEVVESESR